MIGRSDPSIATSVTRATTTARHHAFERLSPWIALVFLVGAVATDRFGWQVAGFNLRFELVIGWLIGIWLLLRYRFRVKMDFGLIERGLIGWIGIAITSSLLFSPARGASIKLTVLIIGLVGLYFVAITLLRCAGDVQRFAAAWSVIGAAVAVVGLIDALLYDAFGTTAGVSMEGNYADGILTVTPKIHSVLWEPNLFGSFSLSVGMLALALSLAPNWRSNVMGWVLRIATACAFCGVMLSMTRTVWVICPLLLLLFALISWRINAWSLGEVALRLVPPIIGIAVGLLIGYTMPSISWRTEAPQSLSQQQISQVPRAVITGGVPSTGTGPIVVPTPNHLEPEIQPTPVAKPSSVETNSAFRDRLLGLLSPNKVASYTGRKQIFARAFSGWLERPWLGWGSGGYMFVYGAAGGTYVANLELKILFETGLIGLLVLAVPIALMAHHGYRLLKQPVEMWQPIHFVLYGLLFGSIGMFLAYQLTEGTLVGFTWVFLGLVVQTVRVCARGGHDLIYVSNPAQPSFGSSAMGES